MIPLRLPANGVPWLYWLHDGHWECRGCGASGRQPPYLAVGPFARWLGDMKRAHAGCSPGVCTRRGEGGVGDPLNPDRAER
jgi:hypothetical protein